VGLFRRRKPLHQRLADAGGLGDDPSNTSAPGLTGQPPGWDGAQRGEPGIHGVPRVRRWDVVTNAAAQSLRGDIVHFVALPDGTLVVEEDEPDDSVAPLADAVEGQLAPPYKAEGVRRGPETWAVAASRIEIAEVRGLSGDRAELVVTREGRTLTVDGRAALGRAPALERLGEVEGIEYVVRAERLDGDLWQVEATAL
jgi:hypothetical protein